MKKITWLTGNWTSCPSDGYCYIEAEESSSGPKMWYIYETDSSGNLKEGFPKANDKPFRVLKNAQKWALNNLSGW